MLDKDWEPPPEFRRPSSINVLRFWLKTVQESGGPRPDYSVFAMRLQAETLIAKYGYVETLQVLQWMANPLSKYYQWPYGLKAVERAEPELAEALAGAKLREHNGFIGPTGLRDLGKDHR